MEFQNVVNIAIGLSASVMGWFLRGLWSAIKELKTDMAKFREVYVQRPDAVNGTISWVDWQTEIKTRIAKPPIAT